MPSFRRELDLEVPIEDAFAWHARPGAFERLVPPFERIRLVSHTPAPEGSSIGVGARVSIAIGRAPLALRWDALHTACEPPRLFVDEQERGPFARWRHEHRFEDQGPQRSRLVDAIEFELPFGAGHLPLTEGVVQRKLARSFRARHVTTAGDLADHAAAEQRLGGARSLRILVAGASGLVGSHLVPYLTTGGHRVVRLVRRAGRGSDEIAWNPARGELDPAAVRGFDAVINLSGAGIADGRWTDERKRELTDSRVATTAVLVRALLASGSPPPVLVQASAVGAYDDRVFERDEAAVFDEASSIAPGFLGDLCRAWEGAALPLAAAGVRCVFARLGVVLDPRGGALAKMLPPFLMGAGGPVGSGRQPLPWIALDDVLGALLHALSDERLRGPVNLVAPQTPTQREFARVLGRVLGRPAFAPLPAPAVRLLFGEMGETLLLRGARVAPAVLAAHGFRHRFAGLEAALRHLLGRPAREES
jgi:hypothetical protein